MQKTVTRIIKDVCKEHNIDEKLATEVFESQFKYIKQELFKTEKHNKETFITAAFLYLGTLHFNENSWNRWQRKLAAKNLKIKDLSEEKSL